MPDQTESNYTREDMARAWAEGWRAYLTRKKLVDDNPYVRQREVVSDCCCEGCMRASAALLPEVFGAERERHSPGRTGGDDQ
jgi:hypothetical protein